MVKVLRLTLMFILKIINKDSMNKKILLSIYFIVSFYGFSQEVTYTSNFAKLQGQLLDEFGIEKMRTVNIEYLTANSEPYSLQVIGNTNYELFLKDTIIYDTVRILYLDDINFKRINNHVFDKLINLQAISFENCKNINFHELFSNLSLSNNLEQLHFENLKFDRLDTNINKLSGLKVITFDSCKLNEFGYLSLNLDEFTISNSKNVLNLNTLFIQSAKRVNIKESVITDFPYNLSSSKGLEDLDFSGTKIRACINNDIRGFKDLLNINITDAKINFKSVRFLDIGEELFIIKDVDVLVFTSEHSITLDYHNCY